MVESGRIVAISISAEKGIPKTNIAEADLRAEWGIVGDAHAGTWHRQISLLAVESIEKIRVMGLDEVQPGDFAENVTTAGFDLMSLKIGDRITLGDAEVEITQIGKECHSHCAIFARVGDCVMPREGLFARVLRGGHVRVNDPVGLSHLTMEQRQK